MKLPELPARGYQNADGWCDDAMRAYGIACYLAALEDAARVCAEEAKIRETRSFYPLPGDRREVQGHKSVTAAKLAAAIRALGESHE